MPTTSEQPKRELTGHEDAAIITLSEKLYHADRSQQTEVCGLHKNQVFQNFLSNQPTSPRRDKLHLLWFMLGTIFVRARNVSQQIVKDIEQETSYAKEQDEVDVNKLRNEMLKVSGLRMSERKRANKAKRIQRLIRGKERMIRNEAKKADLLRGLLSLARGKYAREGIYATSCYSGEAFGRHSTVGLGLR